MKILFLLLLTCLCFNSFGQYAIDTNDIRNFVKFDRVHTNMQARSDSGFVLCNGNTIFISMENLKGAYPLEGEYIYSVSLHTARSLYIDGDGTRFSSLITFHNASHITIRFYEPQRGTVELYKKEVEDELNLKTYNDLTAADKAEMRRNQVVDCPFCANMYR